MKIRTGDEVLYRSRKNGKTYIGFYGFEWDDKYGRRCVSVYESTTITHAKQLANPYIEDVQLLTDELHMLWKLENA